MRFNKFVLAFCLWFTVYAQGDHHNDPTQPAAVDNNDGFVYPTAIANANAATARAAYVVVSKRANATETKGNGTHHGNKDSVKAKCAEINRLTELTGLVNNKTKLADFQAKHNLTTAQMQKIKDTAANATTMLIKLQSNTTLVTACQNLKTNRTNNGNNGNNSTRTGMSEHNIGYEIACFANSLLP